MQCGACQAENRESARFCRQCGVRLGGECPACGAALAPGSGFCDRCGADVSRRAAPPRFASPADYTPRDLVQRILASRTALEGERKQVTVLFADIKASMELLAGRDPEEARRILDPVLELMMEAVHFYEGTVNQVLGDGIMALFGAPLALEDHALRGCYAALRMQERLGRLREAAGGARPPVEVRIGINSGEVLVRAIASDLDMDYTAVGETTHLAGRLEQVAAPGRILCAAATARLAEGYLRLRPLGPLPLKGLAEPVDAFEILGAEPGRMRFQVAAARGLSRFVGRTAEYDVLRQARDRAAEGRGSVVALVGEPGVGKSRLVWEFIRSPLTDGWLVLETAGSPYGTNVPYGPIVALLRDYCHLDDADDAATRRAKVTDRLRELDGALEPALPALLALVGAAGDDPAWQALEPPERRHQTSDAVRRWLRRESAVRPVVVVVEELHWIDHESQALLDRVAEDVATERMLLLVASRPEYSPKWGGEGSYTLVRLNPLPRNSAAQLARALLGDDRALESLQAALVDRAAGNPLFLEETVRALVETGVLVGKPGAYRAVRAVDRLQVPASVQGILAARIDRLAPEDKRLLQAVSAIGGDAPFALVAAVAGAPAAEVRAGLTRLRDAELLYEATLYPEPEYAFAHALIQEVAYGSLVQDARRSLHAAIVAAIERLHAPRLSDHVDRLAHHAERGELWDESARYARQAGEKAAERSAYREAAAYFEQALAALARTPEAGTRLAEAIDLRFQLRNALYPLGEIARDLRHLRTAEPIARALGDPRRLAWVSAYTARDLALLGHPDQAIEAGRQALELAADSGDAELQVLTNAYLGAAYYASGDFLRAVEVLRRTVESLPAELAHRRFGLPGPGALFFRAWLCWSLARRGDFAEGLRRGEEALDVATATGQPLALTVAHYTLGFLALHRGDLPRATAVLGHSLELCRRWNLPAWFPNIASGLGYAHALAGHRAEGLALLQHAVDTTAATGNMARHASEVAMLGEAHLLDGRVAEAGRLAGRALELARAHAERGNEAGALRLLGEVAGRQAPPDRAAAERHYGEALALAEACGMRPLAACCELGLGELCRRVDPGPRAAAHLGRAAALFRAMEMPYWLARTEAASAG